MFIFELSFGKIDIFLLNNSILDFIVKSLELIAWYRNRLATLHWSPLSIWFGLIIFNSMNLILFIFLFNFLWSYFLPFSLLFLFAFLNQRNFVFYLSIVQTLDFCQLGYDQILLSLRMDFHFTDPFLNLFVFLSYGLQIAQSNKLFEGFKDLLDGWGILKENSEAAFHAHKC